MVIFYAMKLLAIMGVYIYPFLFNLNRNTSTLKGFGGVIEYFIMFLL